MYLCNGETDCDDGSDELNEICCKDLSFKCQASGKCINSKYKCDGFSDCDNESDEQNCPARPAAGRINLNFVNAFFKFDSHYSKSYYIHVSYGRAWTTASGQNCLFATPRYVA